MMTSVVRVWIAFLTVLLTAGSVRAEDPLHKRIDRLIAEKIAGTATASPSDDAEFLRRVYLDLAGRIPTSEEAKRFFADAAADKRERLVDRLLDGADYPRRMQELFHVMLLERRGENDQWLQFLQAAFAKNTPWHEIVRAILVPDADDDAKQGAAYFLTARLVSEGAMAPVDVPGLTRDVGRLLAGVDLQCAQCHDHVTVDQYRQRDFQGLHMIFENVKSRRDVKFPAVSENLMTAKKEFMSVFTGEQAATAPLVPGGGEIEIVTFEKGEEYAVPPDRKRRAPGVPKFSPLTELAGGLASEENELFCKNIANRLWFVMMGRGLVEPLDLQHSDNPPTHPELLDLLAREFAASGFDIKWLLRELALTEVYQRSSVLAGTEEEPPPQLYSVANEKRLSAEQLFWSALIATGEFDVDDGGEKSREQTVADSEELAELKERFLKAFANPPKEPEVDFEPSVKGALFLMHDERVLGLLKPRPGNLVDRLAKLQDAREIADELFVAILSRRPTEEDYVDVEKCLDENAENRAKAVGQIAWALLASTEFCVNH